MPEVKILTEQAFTSACVDFAAQLLERIDRQRDVIDRRIAELTALRAELDELARHVRHSQVTAQPGQLVAECAFCPLLDEEGGEFNEA